MRYLEITRRLKERTIVSREEQHKLDAQAFYDMMFNRCDPRKAIAKFVGEVYIQHHPEVADGKEAFIEYFERRAVNFQARRYTSSESSQRATWLCCTAIRSGPALMTMLEWTYFDSMRAESSSSTGTSYKQPPPSLRITTQYSSLLREGPILAASGYSHCQNSCLPSGRFGARSGPIHHSIAYSWSRPRLCDN